MPNAHDLFFPDGTVRPLSVDEYMQLFGVSELVHTKFRPFAVYDPLPFDRKIPDLIELPDGPVSITIYLTAQLSAAVSKRSSDTNLHNRWVPAVIEDYVGSTKEFPHLVPLESLVFPSLPAKEYAVHPEKAAKLWSVSMPKAQVALLDKLSRLREEPRYQTTFEILAHALGLSPTYMQGSTISVQ